MEFTIGDIAALLGGTVQGDSTLKVNQLAKIQEAGTGSIAFLANPKYEPYIYTTQATAVIVNKTFTPKENLQANLILVDDAYLAFTALLEQYQRMVSLGQTGVEEPSFLGTGSQTGNDIYRGAFSYIGKNCKIGNNVKIFPHVFIGDNVTIGDNTVIYAGVKVYHQTTIGKHCTIHAGTVIGSDGFGFAPQADGTYKTIPQIGNVIIEDHVDIGANTVVDRATMGSTVIKKGVKLDNLIQVAHNVEIGSNTVVAAQSGISGSTQIGENCILAGQVGIVGHIKIADRTTVAAQAGIGKSITQAGSTYLGSPAFEHKTYLKSYTVFRKLPDLLKRIEELEEKVINLSSKK